MNRGSSANLPPPWHLLLVTEEMVFIIPAHPRTIPTSFEGRFFAEPDTCTEPHFLHDGEYLAGFGRREENWITEARQRAVVPWVWSSDLHRKHEVAIKTVWKYCLIKLNPTSGSSCRRATTHEDDYQRHLMLRDLPCVGGGSLRLKLLASSSGSLFDRRRVSPASTRVSFLRRRASSFCASSHNVCEHKEQPRVWIRWTRKDLTFKPLPIAGYFGTFSAE